MDLGGLAQLEFKLFYNGSPKLELWTCGYDGVLTPFKCILGCFKAILAQIVLFFSN